jgi:hypothetical protein
MNTPRGMAAAKDKTPRRKQRVYQMTPEAEEAFLLASRRHLISKRHLRIDPKKLAADAVKRGTGD